MTETTVIVHGIETLVVDVGGAMSERRKWIDAFTDNTMIMFTVSLTGYSRFLIEDPSRNEMQDSMLIWESICNAGWFRGTPIMLCFTKNDLFDEEIQHSNVADRFPDFQGAPRDAAAGRDYFINRFLSLVKTGRRVLDEDLYIRVITATDTRMMKDVLNSAEYASPFHSFSI
ncbi:guanine nucleotide binding protein, alpha subunit [Mycena capillaripes]|nr:guanine nucleotide binding protein, alpha subunit [Mycena capillaripes]